MSTWIPVCDAEEIAREEVIRFDHQGRTFAIFRSPDDRYYATDGLCTHEKIHLADGLVIDDTIECPKHSGIFNYTTGEAMGAPVCINLKTYPVRVDGGKDLPFTAMIVVPRGMVVVGAGVCGTNAALQLRKEGYAGPITLIGAERHLPYERPPLSKNVLAEDGGPLFRLIADEDVLASNDIRVVVSNAAVDIDRTRQSLRLASGDRLDYERLLLATGASSRRLASLDHLERVFYLRTFDDAQRITANFTPGARMAVIGAGFIGLELAAHARRRGLEVTVVEILPRILARAVPSEIASLVGELHRAEGVEIITGAGIGSIAEQHGRTRIRLEDGRDIQVDFLAVGVGAQPVTDLAEKAGLAVDNGIRVDRTLQTSAPTIFAAGDCCSFPHPERAGTWVRLESMRNAQDQGITAARNMLGAGLGYEGIPWFWSDQYDHTVYAAGWVGGEFTTVQRKQGSDGHIVFHRAKDGRLQLAAGIGRGNSVARDIRLAEMMISRGVGVDADALMNPEIPLKTLLRAS